MNVAEQIMTASYLDAREKEDLRRAMEYQRRAWVASQFTPSSRFCPVCRTRLQIKVVEHPNRDLGFEGQSVMRCPSCIAHRTFNYALDQGNVFEATLGPGGTVESVRRI